MEPTISVWLIRPEFRDTLPRLQLLGTGIRRSLDLTESSVAVVVPFKIYINLLNMVKYGVSCDVTLASMTYLPKL